MDSPLLFAIGLVLGVCLGIAAAVLLSRRPGHSAGARTLDAALAPVQHELRTLQQHVAAAEQQRCEAHGELRAYAQLMGRSTEQLRDETEQLVTALRAPHVRGRWGEVQLRRVAELAGMLEHCDFDEQASIAGADGMLRPDVVVHLSGDRHIVVDAKVPLAGYLDALAASDANGRAAGMTAQARQLRTHVDALAGKQYWQHVGDSPELVVMFVPSESALCAALEHDPALLEHAFSRSVVVATPSTLIALLRTVALGWRHEALNDNARLLHETGQQLYGRLATFASHLARVGSGLQTAVGAYNQAVGSWESRVMVSARRFEQLPVGDACPDPGAVEVGVRMMRDPIVEEVVQQAQPDDTRRLAAG